MGEISAVIVNPGMGYPIRSLYIPFQGGLCITSLIRKSSTFYPVLARPYTLVEQSVITEMPVFDVACGRAVRPSLQV